MKVLSTILFIVLAMLSTSCDDDCDSPLKTSSDNTFFAKINGVDFNPVFVNGFIIVQGNLTISGSESNGNNVVLNFPTSANVGDTFTIENQFIASFDASNEDAVLSSEGSLTITTHNTETKRVSGSFNFVGSPIEPDGNTYIFTEGTFEVTYTDLN